MSQDLVCTYCCGYGYLDRQNMDDEVVTEPCPKCEGTGRDRSTPRYRPIPVSKALIGITAAIKAAEEHVARSKITQPHLWRRA